MSDDDKYTVAKVTCHRCGFQWSAVYHIDSERLECPNCAHMTTFEEESLEEE